MRAPRPEAHAENAAHRPSNAPSPASRTFAQTLEESLGQALLRSPSARTAVAAGGTLAGLLGLAGCDPAAPEAARPEDTAATRQTVIAYGQKDWAQNLGARDTGRVRYYDEFWRDYSDCSGRYGCMSVTVFVKLLVRPEWGADLSKKKVGAVFREVGKNDPITTTGTYFATRPDGTEEWHVPIKSTRHEGVFTFTAWYEDGKGGRFYDDNNGELYALAWNDAWKDYSTLRQDYPETTATHITAGMNPGAFGTLAFIVEALDYDKDVSLQYSTDNWATSTTLPMGTLGDKNKVFWNKNLGADYEQWKAEIEVPGTFTDFQFKLVYRHGVVAGARTSEFVLGGPAGLMLPKM